MNHYPKIIGISLLDDYNILLEFTNGEKKLYDFKPNLNHPYYKELENMTLFKNVTVNDGEIEWATGQDFCPHTIYEKSVPYQADRADMTDK